jgi:hypothetical protein
MRTSVTARCQLGTSPAKKDLVLSRSISLVRSLCEYLGISRWNVAYAASGYKPGKFYTQIRIPPRPALELLQAVYPKTLNHHEDRLTLFVSARWVETNPDEPPVRYRFHVWSPDAQVNEDREVDVTPTERIDGRVDVMMDTLSNGQPLPRGIYFVWAQARGQRATHESDGIPRWSPLGWQDLAQRVDVRFPEAALEHSLDQS